MKFRAARDGRSGRLGDHATMILADARFDVASRAYRLRILNGSNARIYKLGWDDGTPLTVIVCGPTAFSSSSRMG